MKKIFSFILLVIVTITAFTPCCPTDNCQDEVSSFPQKKDDKKTEGACSPFNSCTSCPGFTIATKNITVFKPVSFEAPHNTEYLVYISDVHFNSPWQPPREI